MEHIQIERKGNVAVISWHHEEQNRFTTSFLKEVLHSFDEVSKDRSVSSVVVTSTLEKYFTTGIHLEWLMKQAYDSRENVLEFMRHLNRTLLTAVSFPKPLVAAINGHVVAGGAILSACMDFRLMVAAKGFVRLPEVQIDIPFWPGMTAIFKDILPPASFREMAYTGERFTSEQAHEMGYIDQLLTEEDLVPRAVELASKLGEAKTTTYAAIKHGLRKTVIETMKNEDPKVFDMFTDNLVKAARGS